MTTAEVAKRLKISIASVRRRFDAGVFEGFFTPTPRHEDVRGFELRGHRRIYVDSVEAYEERMRKARVDAAHGPAEENS